jgi:hypothetical protein
MPGTLFQIPCGSILLQLSSPHHLNTLALFMAQLVGCGHTASTRKWHVPEQQCFHHLFAARDIERG